MAFYQKENKRKMTILLLLKFSQDILGANIYIVQNNSDT